MPEIVVRELEPRVRQDATIYSQRFLRDLVEEEPTREAWGEGSGRVIFPRPWPLSLAVNSGTTETITITQAITTGGPGLIEGTTTEVGTVEENEARVKDLIYRTRQLPVSYRDSLAKRLFELFEDSKEEDPQNVGISLGSLQGFYRFLQSYPYLRKPALSLTPDFDIYASWRSGTERVFSIHFLASGLVRFAIIAPAHNHPGQNIRLSGVATMDNFMEKVSPWDVLSWAGNGRR